MPAGQSERDGKDPASPEPLQQQSADHRSHGSTAGGKRGPYIGSKRSLFFVGECQADQRQSGRHHSSPDHPHHPGAISAEGTGEKAAASDATQITKCRAGTCTCGRPGRQPAQSRQEARHHQEISVYDSKLLRSCDGQIKRHPGQRSVEHRNVDDDQDQRARHNGWNKPTIAGPIWIQSYRN